MHLPVLFTLRNGTIDQFKRLINAASNAVKIYKQTNFGTRKTTIRLDYI